PTPGAKETEPPSGLAGLSSAFSGASDSPSPLASDSSSARSSMDLNGLAPGGSGGSSPYPATIASQAAASSKGTPFSSGSRPPSRSESCSATCGRPFRAETGTLLLDGAGRQSADERGALLEDPLRVIVQRR